MGRHLNLKLLAIQTTFWTCKKFFLEINCNLSQCDGSDLRYDAANAAQVDVPVLVNSALHSIFSECIVTANGVKVSNSNGVYAHKVFIETKCSNRKEAKDTCLICHGYTYEAYPGDLASAVFTSRRAETRES